MMMINKDQYSLTKTLVETQLQNFFPITSYTYIDGDIHSIALKRTSNCIDSISTWSINGFDRFISWQYATYLYFLSREIFVNTGNKELSTRLFLLNKALNGLELYYEIELPNYFFLSHTPGLVLGKAQYSNYCIFHQGCTVGRNKEDKPILDEGVVMYPNSSIIGKCHVHSNTVLAPGVQLVNQDSPGNCYVFIGEKGKPIFKELNEKFAERYFDK